MQQFLACSNHPEVVEELRHCARCGQVFCRDCVVDILGQPFCARCKSEQLLDLASGVNFSQLELADVGRRFVALLIDTFIIGLPLGALFVTFFVMVATNKADMNPAFMMPLFIMPTILFIMYEGLMLGARGQTVGKIVMKIRVVRPDGTPLGKGQAWGRALMRTILAGCLSLFNYLPAFFTKDKTCLHDLVANTRVVNWS